MMSDKSSLELSKLLGFKHLKETDSPTKLSESGAAKVGLKDRPQHVGSSDLRND